LYAFFEPPPDGLFIKAYGKSKQQPDQATDDRRE